MFVLKKERHELHSIITTVPHENYTINGPFYLVVKFCKKQLPFSNDDLTITFGSWYSSGL